MHIYKYVGIYRFIYIPWEKIKDQPQKLVVLYLCLK